MDPRLREVVQTAGVVEIEVRQHDVANVLGPEAEAFDLADGGHFLTKIGAQQGQEEAAQTATRVRDVTQTEAGVDEGEAFVAFNQQAVAAQPAALGQRSSPPVHETAAERA